MIETVVALLMMLKGDVVEHTYKEKMSECLKSKRIAERQVRPERVQFSCKKVKAQTEIYMGSKKDIEDNINDKMINKKSEQETKVLKQLTESKIDLKDKGDSDLEAQIEILKKEVDTLKSVIDIKQLEIDKEKKAKELFFKEIGSLRKVIREKNKLIDDLYKYP